MSVWLDGECIGKMKYRFKSIQDKPYYEVCMVNGGCDSPEYDNCYASTMGLLEIYHGRDLLR